jgi:hypothetical protein
MSDNDPTKDIAEKYETKPTLETILERINALDVKMDRRFDALESRLEAVETLVDRVSSVIYETRADVRELKGALKVQEPR